MQESTSVGWAIQTAATAVEIPAANLRGRPSLRGVCCKCVHFSNFCYGSIYSFVIIIVALTLRVKGSQNG